MKESKEYKEYLESDDWKHIRANKIEEANGICEQCGWPLGNSVPHVHHESYDNLGHEEPEDLKVLHTYCHERKHPHMKEVKKDD